MGNSSAPDTELLDWAAHHGYILFTHDLDFAALLAFRSQVVPSVIQLRGQETSPEKVGAVLLALTQLRDELQQGALISVDAKKIRARGLPLR